MSEGKRLSIDMGKIDLRALIFGFLAIFLLVATSTGATLDSVTKVRCKKAYQSLLEEEGFHIIKAKNSFGNLYFPTDQISFADRVRMKKGRSIIGGRVVGISSSGLDFLDPKTGQMHYVYPDQLDSIEVMVRSEKVITRQHAPRGVNALAHLNRQFDYLSESLGRSSALFELATPNIEWPGSPLNSYLYGRLEKRSTAGLNTEFEIVSPKGDRHRFDLKYAQVLSAHEINDAEIAKLYAQFPYSRVSAFDQSFKERRKWLELLKNDFSGRQYYSYFEQKPEELLALLQRWYPNHYKRIVQKIEKSIGAKYLPLLTDPALANHTNQLVKFASSYLENRPGLAPEELRAAYLLSPSTKKVKIYRGMMLTADQVESMRKNGILARALMTADSREKLDHYFDSMIRNERFGGEGPLKELDSKFKTGYKEPFYISASHYEPVARSVGYWSSGQKNHGNLYVFEMEIPEPLILRLNGIFNRRLPMMNAGEQFTVGEFKLQETDKGIEVFIPFFIPPEYIKNVVMHKNEPPVFVVKPSMEKN